MYKYTTIAAYKWILILCFISSGSCTWLEDYSNSSDPTNILPIATSSGVVQGQTSLSKGKKIVGWLDIPYAQPPVGKLRWRAPRALIAPDQIIKDIENNACVQPASDYAGIKGQGVVGTEDCLYLDIKAPEGYADRQYPVMLWIHGGGNTTGLKDYYNFSAMVASQDVVVVTINYRLGALGWFTHPAIQDFQQGLDKTSNFGLLDIIQSLKWVRENIQQFGGNPDNITVFGESAGGHNVLALLASPLSEGLFHRAISQSGYTTSVTPSQAYNYKVKDHLIKRGSWQMANKMLQQSQNEVTPAILRERLLAIDAREFVSLYYNQDGPYFDKIPLTTDDGIVIPKQGLLVALSDSKLAKNIPVIAGATKDEITLWLGLHRYFIDKHYPLTKLFPAVYRLKDPQLYHFWVRQRSQAWKLKAVDRVLSALHTAGYRDLYAYRFDWDHQKSSFFIEFPEIFGAAHGTDIAFVTGAFTYGPISSYIYPQGPDRDQMERTMMGAWGSFSKFGQPSRGQHFSWQPFTRDNPTFLYLDIDSNLYEQREATTIKSLLEEVAGSPFPTELERCHIVWEIHTNIGKVDEQGYKNWDNGRCRGVDIIAEQKALADRLIAEYGSVEVF
jgi:para-nitrobenzyl esterase